MPQTSDAFRDEVREFLAQSLTPDILEGARRMTSVFADKSVSVAWQRILHAKGWVAPSWPMQYGGTGWNETQRYVFASECAKAGAPSLAPMGLKMVGPAIMQFGTDAQKNFYLPRILSAEHYWCQGYSEPGSGSDLASLQLRATSDGDDYVLNGSKIWTTHAHVADWMFCLVRTRFDGKPQAGITFLLLDMRTPGIEVKPILTLAGDHELNQVFFDDVRVPKANRLGEENDGWTVAKYLLTFERGSGGAAAGLRASLDRLTRATCDLMAGDAAFRSKAAELAIRIEAIEMTERRLVAAFSTGESVGPVSSLLKIQSTETMQQLDELAIEAVGIYGPARQSEAQVPGSNEEVIGPPEHALAMSRYLNNRAGSIYGGSNEIQRNIIAQILLGL
ncbi:MAG TPA: acyl-CoA dehydrogenase family protein [Rhizomicrobium sp.]|nr:acyl-CoA dehydrogenase family protein [Rhizomicrobium sp.]